MHNFFQTSVYFGVLLTLSAYGLGTMLKKRFQWTIFNPLLIGLCICIIVVLTFDIDYQVYYEGAKYISYLLTPATVCLAIPLYDQIERLKENKKAIIVGICSGVLISSISILFFAGIFGLKHQEYVTLLPKSITTAIGMGISEELGGYVTITVAVILITGIFGNMIASTVCKCFRIEEPVAKGIAIGSASHAIGTVKALEMGEIEGAMSSLSIAVAGVLTVAASSVFAQFL